MGDFLKKFSPQLGVFLIVFLFLFNNLFIQVLAWSNGGYSENPLNPDYGTHDWIAEHALDWLPELEKEYITTNLFSYLYGTELPDNPNPEDGIGDKTKHHIYFNSDESLADDIAAVRAQEEYNRALTYLEMNETENAAKTVGVMIHYIADMSVFGHVMGSSTEWGSEVHHSDYETYVNSRTNSYNDEFNVYLSFDGSLDEVTAYEAAIDLAFDTTFDVDGDLTCKWMDNNYNWSNLNFCNRCGESLSLAVNSATDVLHTLFTLTQKENDRVVINEVELNPSGNDNYLNVEEWVELYNPMPDTVDLSGWTLSTTNEPTVTITIPQGTVLATYGYYVLGRGSQWLDNDNESVFLKDSGGTEIDRTPTISDDNNNYLSWQRYYDGEDNWSFRLSTKGSSNGRDITPPILSIQSPANEQFYTESNVSLTFSSFFRRTSCCFRFFFCFFFFSSVPVVFSLL